MGARLLKAWSFPELMITATKHGEKPADGPEAALPLLAHLHAGKYVATSFGPGVSEDGFLFELNTAFLVQWGFTPELLHETMALVHERAKRLLQDRLTHGAVML